MRDGNMKAVFWQDEWELHDMSKNRNETDNLAKSMPEVLETMKKNWKAWYVSVGGSEVKKSKKKKKK